MSSGENCPAEFRLPRITRAWTPYADPTLHPKAESCSLHRNRCSTHTCPWRHPNEGARCGGVDAEDQRAFPLAADWHISVEKEPEHSDSPRRHTNMNLMESTDAPTTSRMKKRPMQCGCKCQCTKRARSAHFCGECEASVCDGKCFREDANVCHMCLPQTKLV